MPTIRNSGELEEWGEEELRNLAGFSSLGLVLLRILLEKYSLPTTRGKNPGKTVNQRACPSGPQQTLA